MPARRKQRDSATRFQVLLERLKANEALRLAKAVQALGPKVAGWLAEQAATGTAVARRRTTQRELAKLADSMGAALRPAVAELVATLADVALVGAEFELGALRAITREARKRVALAEAAKPAELALATPLSANGLLPQVFVEAWLANAPKRVTARIAQGFARGETVDELVRAVRGTKARNFRDGLLDATRREAEAVVRTAVQHQASVGRQSVWEANRDVVAGYRFVATLDARTTTVCRSLDGQTFEVGKGPVPPVHINCRSTTVAELNPSLGLDFLDTGATRSSADGYVPAELTFYDWLKTQSAAYQNEVLGPTRGKLFRDGGLSSDEFASLQLDRNFRPMTLDAMRKAAPAAFSAAGL